MMRIGIDVDGVLADYNTVFMTAIGVPVHDPTTYSYIDGGLISHDRYKVVHDSIITKCDMFPVLDKSAASVLSQLISDGHDIVIATARGIFSPEMQKQYSLYDLTKKFLNKAGIPFNEIYLNADHDKTQYGLDMMVDDSPDVLTSFDPDVTVPVTVDHVYNRSISGHRISEMSQLPAIIDEVAETR